MSNDEIKCENCECDDDKQWRKCVTDQLKAGDKRMDSIEQQVGTIKDDTGELVEILKAVKGGLKVLQAIGVVAKWGTGIVVFVGAVVSIVQGKWPGK